MNLKFKNIVVPRQLIVYGQLGVIGLIAHIVVDLVQAHGKGLWLCMEMAKEKNVSAIEKKQFSAMKMNVQLKVVFQLRFFACSVVAKSRLIFRHCWRNGALFQKKIANVILAFTVKCSCQYYILFNALENYIFILELT